MNLLCIGGDRRTLSMSKFLHKKGHKISALGLDTATDIPLCAAVKTADAVILPLPVSTDGLRVRTPLSKEIIYLDDIVLCRPRLVLGGMLSNEFKLKLEREAIPFFDYYDSEPLTVKNALLTAEAAVSIAIKETPFSLFQSEALVLGYGRIGKILSRYLKALGANVTATSRNNGTLAVISTDGFDAVNTADIFEELPKFDFIFNTAPTPIMDRRFFGSLQKHCLVEDLATASGLDTLAAEEYNIKTLVLPGLPGKFFAQTAGKLIGIEISNFLEQQK